jgi:hypothetical protein
MSDDSTAPDWVSEAVQARGPVPRGHFRVAVIESSGDLSVRDFADMEIAKQYANDAASESDHPSPLAYVFDDGLRFVVRGRHYAAPA